MSKKMELLKILEKNNCIEQNEYEENIPVYLIPSNDPTIWAKNMKALGIKSLDQVLEYLRKSRADMQFSQEESLEKTLQRHKKDLDELCLRYFGETIPDKNIYKEVVSGESLAERDEINNLLTHIEDDDIKVVVVIEVERLARGDTIDQGVIIQTFQYTNTKILTLNRLYDLSRDSDRAEFEDSLKKSRDYINYVKGILKRGRKRSVLDGKFPGSIAKYGFTREKIPNDKGYRLVENPIEAFGIILMTDAFLDGINEKYIVKKDDTISSIAKYFCMSIEQLLIHNMDVLKCENENRIESIKEKLYEKDSVEELLYNIRRSYLREFYFEENQELKIIIENAGTTVVANYLNIKGVVPRKNEKWTSHAVYNVLTSWAIAGYLTWNYRKTTTKIENGKKVTRRIVNEKPTIVKGLQKGIISLERFIKIQEKLSNNKTGSVVSGDTTRNPLMGVVVCSVCGKNMQRRSYYEDKKARNRIIRKHTFTAEEKKELKELLRNKKGELSYTNIGRALGVSRDVAASFFLPYSKTVPKAELWEDLKKLLNIEDSEWDKKITECIEIKPPVHCDTLICNTPRCKNVSHDLHEVEAKIIEALKICYKEYKTYLDNYEKEHLKEQKDYSLLIEQTDNSIKDLHKQKMKICELRECGDYDSETFNERNNIIEKKIEKLLKQKQLIIEEAKNDNYSKKASLVPKLELFLDTYSNDLTPEEKNNLLKSVVKKVTYTKKEKGTKGKIATFEIEIEPLLPF